MCVLSKEASIRHLINNNIIDMVDSVYESRASVVRFNVTTNSMSGAINHSIKYASLRIQKRLIVWLYNNTSQYSVRSYISALYFLGIGLPKNLDAANFWKVESYGVTEHESKCCLYPKYRKMLKDDISASLTDGMYLYTKDVNKQFKLLELLDNCPNADYEKCIIVYKRAANCYKFYNMIVGKNNFVFDFEPNFEGAKKVYNEYYSNVKYIVCLGHLKKQKTYRYKGSIATIVGRIASQYCDAKDIKNFSKKVYFEQKDVVLINFEGKVKKFMQQIKNSQLIGVK